MWAVGAGLLVAGLVGAFLSVPLVAIAAAWVSYYRTRDDPGQEAEEPAVPPPEGLAAATP